jgi:hypothetical protein
MVVGRIRRWCSVKCLRGSLIKHESEPARNVVIFFCLLSLWCCHRLLDACCSAIPNGLWFDLLKLQCGMYIEAPKKLVKHLWHTHVSSLRLVPFALTWTMPSLMAELTILLLWINWRSASALPPFERQPRQCNGFLYPLWYEFGITSKWLGWWLSSAHKEQYILIKQRTWLCTVSQREHEVERGDLWSYMFVMVKESNRALYHIISSNPIVLVITCTFCIEREKAKCSPITGDMF